MLFTISIFIYILSLIIRTFRSVYILSDYVHKPAKYYLRSLWIADILGLLLPHFISNIIRVSVFSKYTKTSFRMSFGLYFIELFFDLLISIIILYILKIQNIYTIIIFLILLLAILFINSSILKKIYYLLSSLFNDSIKSVLLGLYWSLFRIRNNIFKIKKKLIIFILLSIVFNITLLFSIFIFSKYLNDDTIIKTLFSQFNLIIPSNITELNSLLKNNNTIYTILYILIPNIIVTILSFIPFNERNKNYQLKIIPYVSQDSSLHFFDYYFNNKYTINDEIYYNIINNSYVIKDISAASEAKTFLIENNGILLVRKVAIGNAAIKLKTQFEWLCKNNKLSLPKIIDNIEKENLFSYDMEYFGNAETLFTNTHYLTLEQSWTIIKNILSDLNDTYITYNDTKTYNTKFFENYIKNNINISLTNSEINKFLEYNEIIVNYEIVPNILNMSQALEKYIMQLNYDIKYIHGDLTMENILVDSNVNYIIIDPSPMYNNIFSEYAKLFQSLHGKYEYLKKSKNWNIDRNHIKYADYSTKKYEDLFINLKNYITEKHGIDGLKATYFYEGICHLRTLSYMTRLKNENAILMLALSGKALNKWREL